MATPRCRHALALLVTPPLWLFAPSSYADSIPQVSVAVTSGYALTDLRDHGVRGAFHLGGRADVLFLRKRETSYGIGPYVSVISERFESIETGGGVEGLFPVLPSFPLVVGAGGFARHTGIFGWEPGLAAHVLFGPRSYNFSSAYSVSNGVFVEGRYGLGDGKQADVIAGVQIDVAILAFPFILAAEAMR